MTEKLITFTQAKKFKDAGFGYPVYELYLSSGEFFTGGDFMDKMNHNAYPDVISAPTLSHAAQWLREVKGLHVEVCKPCISSGWTMLVKILMKEGLAYFEGVQHTFSDHDSAYSAGIDKALELLTLNEAP